MHVDASANCSAKRNKVERTPEFHSHPSNPEMTSRKNVKYYNEIMVRTVVTMEQAQDKVDLLMSHPKAYYALSFEEERWKMQLSGNLLQQPIQNRS